MNTFFTFQGATKLSYAAMKLEERKRNRNDEILRMEVFVLLKLQAHPSFCTVYARGQTPEFTWVLSETWLILGLKTSTPIFSYMVMTLLSKSLLHLRQHLPSRKFSQLSALRIGVQLMNVSHHCALLCFLDI
jgi:hypothetical protein